MKSVLSFVTFSKSILKYKRFKRFFLRITEYRKLIRQLGIFQSFPENQISYGKGPSRCPNCRQNGDIRESLAEKEWEC